MYLIKSLTLRLYLAQIKREQIITQKLINKGLRWIAGLQKAKSFINVYSISKDLNIPPLSAKYALSQVKCFDKWKDSNCIISYLVNNIPKSRKYTWTKESRTLKRKLEKRGNNDNKIKDFLLEKRYENQFN